ncbi:hypothetical protein ZHAS_00015593 [Anopheles sinensis]|uniref:Uncharacterized protein n=1 Tax=Anopheles sinensis TaxID=74873 RepID=A0A084WAV9_ANOSI|nr:hypothetical protein ZHAS_00015593 [Anopheles sinensis]
MEAVPGFLRAGGSGVQCTSTREPLEFGARYGRSLAKVPLVCGAKNGPFVFALGRMRRQHNWLRFESLHVPAEPEPVKVCEGVRWYHVIGGNPSQAQAVQTPTIGNLPRVHDVTERLYRTMWCDWLTKPAN